MTSLLVRRAPGWRGVAVEAGVVALALLANLLVRRLTLDDLQVATANAHSLLALQERWGLDWEHAAQRSLDDLPCLGTFASWFYVWGYFPVLIATLVSTDFVL